MYRNTSFNVNYHILVGFTYNCPDFMEARSNTRCNKDHGRPPLYGIPLFYDHLVKHEIANVSSIQECPLLCAEKLKELWTKDRHESPGCCEWRIDNKCYWSLDNAAELYIGYDSLRSFNSDEPPEGTRALLCTAGLNFLVQFYLIIQRTFYASYKTKNTLYCNDL